MSFVHLHTHSHYSLLDGLAKVDGLVSTAKEMGMPAIALTDHGNLYGAIEFYQTAKKAGIKAILGVEAYITAGSLHEKNPGIDDKRYHLILLVKNLEGYKNLVKLVSIAHLEGFYYKPRMDKQILKKYSGGLIALSGCMSGEIPRALLAGDEEKAERLLKEYQDIFGKENFYIEISTHPHVPNHPKLRAQLIEFAKKTGTPLVGTQDVHYLKKEDAEAQDVLLAVQTNTKIDDEDRLTMKDDDYSLKTPEEMRELFLDVPEAAENTVRIAEKCNLVLELGKIQLPQFEVPSGETAASYLEKLCREGLTKRFAGAITPDIEKRLGYELSVINKTGFIEYFLIVSDFVNWAKQNGIIVGPGRGSAAGSLISYVLGITNIDPIKYNLIFERFLNPERVEPPDIDLDFADTRRDEVIEYVAKKYGRERVAQIITFGTMAARAAIRDAGRALGMSLLLCDQLAKMIPFNPNQNEKEGYLAQCLASVPELKAIYNTNQDAKKIIDSAMKLEGVARHASVHASGIVISRDPLSNTVPLQRATLRAGDDDFRKEAIVTQYDMHAILAMGLLKMDFLGLKNLSIIEETLKLVKEKFGKEIDLENLNLEDPGPYKMLSEGKTVGVFQLEGTGMTRYLKELRPTSIEDIIAMISLFRPGPMELIPSFILRKHGKEEVRYLHPKLESILKNTYGIAVYQEQLMQIARDLAGFTMAEADILRKAIGKKIRSLLEEQKKKFVDRMLENKIPGMVAEELGELLEPFARYGFNRSHAACYAMLGFQTAYLKYYYPLEFMISLLNGDRKDTERISFLIKECKNLGLSVLPPTVNTSNKKFSSPEGSKKEIRFGLFSIKNVGQNVVEALIAEREREGPYLSLANFLERIDSKNLNKKSIEALAKAGALDDLGERQEILKNIDRILEYVRHSHQLKIQKQSSLFSMMEDTSSVPSLRLEKIAPATLDEKLNWEKELLGLYVSGHPLDKFWNKLKSKNKVTIEIIKSQKPKTMFTINSIIMGSRRILTKNGDPMMFLKLGDLTDEIEAVVFPRILEKCAPHIFEDNCVLVRGKFSERNGIPSIIAEDIKQI